MKGLPVDRPAVSFCVIDGRQDVNDPDPFNIYNAPDWQPIIQLAREKTDRIVSCQVSFTGGEPSPLNELTTVERWNDDNGNRICLTSIKAGKRVLTRITRRDPTVDTIWTEEHLLKDVDDLQAYLQLPESELTGNPDISDVIGVEQELGEAGIVRVETPDPLCLAADLFDMATYTVVAMTEPQLFTKLLERFSRQLYPQTEAICKELPGRMWRIYGPEYASCPYLPPHLFHEYVSVFDRPMIDMINHSGGFSRLHSHGRLKEILDEIVAMGAQGLDPIEPPPQGNVSLAYVRERYGDQLVLFGNLEACDLENLPPAQFREKIQCALKDGPGGRGFVLMPSASPYGRNLTPHTLPNYLAMVQAVDA